MLITTCTGTKCCIETTKSVKVLVQCKYVRKTWVTFKDMKNAYHIQMAKYVVQCPISGNLVFPLWIRHVLEKRNHIVGNLKSKYWVRTHNYGIKIPKSVQEAESFDKENGNTLR